MTILVCSRRYAKGFPAGYTVGKRDSTIDDRQEPSNCVKKPRTGNQEVRLSHLMSLLKLGGTLTDSRPTQSFSCHSWNMPEKRNRRSRPGRMELDYRFSDYAGRNAAGPGRNSRALADPAGGRI